MNKPNTSLRVAIFNAFERNDIIPTDKLVGDIETNVRDFLAQKFQWALLAHIDANNALKTLWEKIRSAS
jgi:hypothetical protein